MPGLPMIAGASRAMLGIITGAVMVSSALAQSNGNAGEDDSRGVRIIDAPTAPVLKPAGSETASAPPVLTPAPETKLQSGAAASAPVLLPAAPELRPAVEAPASPTIARPSTTLEVPALSAPASPAIAPPSTTVAVPTLAPPTLSPPSAPSLRPSLPPGSNGVAPPPKSNLANLPQQPEPDVQALSNSLKVPNVAGVSMQILPGPDIEIGAQVTFQVSSKKAGYLILVDVDASGKLVQIFPNPLALMAPGGIRENMNYLRPSKPIRIPDKDNIYAGFEFVAAPPTGTAMMVAILSDRPVQRIDLPDVPVSLVGSASAAEYLTKLANELRIPDATGNGHLQDPHWSFDAKFYAIR
jgi:hypothetical protein